MKHRIIRILSVIVAALSLISLIPLKFDFYGNLYSFSSFAADLTISGIEIYFEPAMIAIGVLGLISMLWNLVCGAYAIIDGRYKNLFWRIARYGYFYGIVVGIVNIWAIIGTEALPAVWIYVASLAVTVAVEIVLIVLKDEKAPQNQLDL